MSIVPIKYALTYPERVSSGGHKLSLFDKNLSFFQPDRNTFNSLDIAVKATEMGGLYPTVMNAANEQAVALFLDDKISFSDITYYVQKSLDEIKIDYGPDDINSVLAVDKLTREYVLSLVGE